MSNQFTPEELEIIEETKRQGAEIAEQEPESKKRMRPLMNVLTFAIVFVLFVLIGGLILILV